MEIIKIGMMGLAGVLLATMLKKEKSEYGILISLVACVVIFAFVISKMQVILAFVERLESMLSIDSSYIALILKMIGIAYVAGFAMDICKDAGYGAIGNQIEMFAKLSILVVSLPVLLTFLEVIGKIL